MKHRSRVDIAAAVLNIAQDGALKTQMMYKGLLTFRQVEEYLDLLIEQDLIEYVKGENAYYTTAKGRRFLKMYNDVGWMIFPKGAIRQTNLGRRG